MKGPGVYRNFLIYFKKKRKEAHLINLLNQGSCNLHIAHVALQAGTENTGSQFESHQEKILPAPDIC